MASPNSPYFGDNPTPRYLQLAQLMRQRIARGQWPQGHRLPSLDELVQEFGVARVTVRQAVDMLARDGLLAFVPRYVLWTDGAVKRRWLALPAGTTIDTSDPAHWQLPVGATLVKEFASPDGVRLETRLIERVAATGDPQVDYWMGAFVWDDDDADARFVPDGARDVRGTAHNVPTVKNCFTCHDGDAGRVLGFSAVQLPEVPPEVLSDPPLHSFVPPGDAVASAALGYLHANCAHCHNPQGSARPDTDMNTRLAFDDRIAPGPPRGAPACRAC